MDLKQIKTNYKKKNRNALEILHYQYYINVPKLSEQLKNCEKAIDKEKLQNVSDLYLDNLKNVEKRLKDIIEVKNATLTDLKQCNEELLMVSNELSALYETIEIFRQHILEDDAINNGMTIFMTETSLFLLKADIDLVIEKLAKK
ncbi:MAG: hypothetical protein J6J60_06690 [Clostridia bacterium]|nr:hypothetical protein [Clostridia bacterium]